MPRGLRSERGQATLELALCMPVFALLMAMLVEAGGLATDHVRLWHIAREAARVAVVDPDEAEARAAAARVGLDDVDLDIDPGVDARVRGEPLTVTASYSPNGRVPLIGELFRSLTLRATATMRIERP